MTTLAIPMIISRWNGIENIVGAGSKEHTSRNSPLATISPLPPPLEGAPSVRPKTLLWSRIFQGFEVISLPWVKDQS